MSVTVMGSAGQCRLLSLSILPLSSPLEASGFKFCQSQQKNLSHEWLFFGRSWRLFNYPIHPKQRHPKAFGSIYLTPSLGT